MEIRDLTEADAPGLQDLFRRCYGDTYGTRLFYDAAALRTAIGEGRLRSVIAAEAGGRVIGHTGLTIRHPGALVCEAGNTVVDPAERGRGLLRQLGQALGERVRRDGFAGYVHYPTTAHAIMQKSSVANGGTEVGVMLAYIADTTEYAAIARRAGRLAATVAYQPFASVPQRRVRVPVDYRPLIEELYTRARLDRTITTADEPHEERETKLESAFYSTRGLLHLHVTWAGSDVGSAVASAMRQANPAVTHVDIALDQPLINRAAEALAGLGFFFCALLPEFTHIDVLRLQRLAAPQRAVFEPDVVTNEARHLCALMRREAESRTPIE